MAGIQRVVVVESLYDYKSLSEGLKGGDRVEQYELKLANEFADTIRRMGFWAEVAMHKIPNPPPGIDQAEMAGSVRSGDDAPLITVKVGINPMIPELAIDLLVFWSKGGKESSAQIERNITAELNLAKWGAMVEVDPKAIDLPVLYFDDSRNNRPMILWSQQSDQQNLMHFHTDTSSPNCLGRVEIPASAYRRFQTYEAAGAFIIELMDELACDGRRILHPKLDSLEVPLSEDREIEEEAEEEVPRAEHNSNDNNNEDDGGRGGDLSDGEDEAAEV